MALGEPVDFKVLGRLLTQQKQKDDAVENVVGFWKQHYRQLPDNILDLMGVIDPEEMDSTMPRAPGTSIPRQVQAGIEL